MVEEVFFKGAVIDEEPILLFDKADSSAVHKEPYFGLKAFGPFDKQCDVLKVGIITPESASASVQAFVRTLQVGDARYFSGGMKNFFRTDLKVSSIVETTGTSLKDYMDAGSQFVEKTSQGDVDVVVCFIPRTSNLYTNTPYYRLKAVLSVHGFPSQMLTQATLNSPTFSYLNVASALFAKSGHIPWALGGEMPNTNIIIGISIADRICDNNRLAQNRYIGYVNVFDEYGKWMFFEGIAEAYKKEEMSGKMVELVKRDVKKYYVEKGIIPENIHIHYWKRFSKIEKENVIKMLQGLKSDVKVAFTSINTDHPYRFYDLESCDGSFMRGYYVYLDDSILLSTTGTTDEFRRTFRMGTPKLLHVRTEQYPEEFITSDELAYQMLALTKLNWATTSVLIREPITLTFSNRLAYLTSVITESEWKQLQVGGVNINMRNKPWFI